MRPVADPESTQMVTRNNHSDIRIGWVDELYDLSLDIGRGFVDVKQ